ncbi:zinc finger MYM-type protein 4-like isoform X1 [Argiope bruennichi]|uniref:zinc finger MYM-type protein 4-like isoform X1 n=1 Tax=Argiope bruennichi TaxID=94029 RepID=UPI00249546BD|nr:zinc finger MYM-type protein 4-like isoform X1 [Argiope bruennichi]XP_055931992.1 zinc finger MYM-type protein 4-like isoform X1 [Argiope bruennichi]
MPKARKQSTASLAKKARARKDKVPLLNSDEKPQSVLETTSDKMTESTSDVEIMDINDSGENVVSSSVSADKENGICNKNAPNDILVKKSKNDVIKSSSNHDANISGDEVTNSDSIAEEENKNEANSQLNLSGENDSQSAELKDSLKTDSKSSENHNDTDLEVKCIKVENESSDCPSSTVTSGKQVFVDENVKKPNFIPERVLDESPKYSPETIVSDDGPLEGKSKTDNSDVSEVRTAKADDSDAKTNGDASNTNADAEDKKYETKHKNEGKSSGKKEGEGGKKKKKTCAQCGMKKKLNFRIVFQGKAYQLCSEICYKDFKQQQTVAPKPAPPPPVEITDEKCGQCQKKIISGQSYFPAVGVVKPLCSEECLRKYHDHNGPPRNCSQCKKKIESVYSQLTWETMVFCNEDCLGKYQSFLGSHCTCCQTPVQQSSLGKYCVCFGADIRQFCSGTCLEEFKKGLKVCSFCQTDLSAGTDGFLAPVGDKGQFKDFCSQQCMERYEVMNNISKTVPDVQECSHCKKQGSFKTQIKYEDKMYSLCCDLCVAGFRSTYKITDKICDTCYKFFKPSADENFSLKFEGFPKHFCTKACMTLFVLSHRKIIQCIQCKVKKYTFDMIERISENNQVQMYCSLNCLSLFRVNLSATSSKCIRCDNCAKNIPAQYHLTMSDGSIRNFCTYQCVLLFQNQFTAVPALTTSTTTRQATTLKPGLKTTSTTTSTPIIANVVSLAQAPRPVTTTQNKSIAPQTLVSVRQQGPSLAVLSPKSTANSPLQISPAIASATLSVAAPSAGNPPAREIIVRPPVPKSVKNKSASCKPIMQNKGVSAKLPTCHKSVQTDERPMPLILPVPVPIYVPTPMHMFSRPVPCPVPFPIPIPVPIIVPPSKPYKDLQEDTAVQSDELKTSTETCNHNKKKSSKTVSKSFNEDTELSQKDTLHTPINQNNIHAQNNADLDIEDENDYDSKENKVKHRNKRGGDIKQKDAKKPKLEEVNSLEAILDEETDRQIAEMMNSNTEESDSKLKYAFGINAWRQWILEKNVNMEKGTYNTRKLKYLKTDILQFSPEELNYYLSQFVREIRRPSGESYTAGAIFYLILGLQMYLHENGRIDNILADECYDAFTDQFHLVLSNYETRALALEVPFSRIEEEFLWDSRQLGAHSPQVLLNTLIYFNAKYFKMKEISDHVGLCFPHIGRHVDKQRARNGNFKGYLRYYGPYYDGSEEEEEDDDSILLLPENNNNHLRCPVRLYEFYISKCPAGVWYKGSQFYLTGLYGVRREDPIWFTTRPLSEQDFEKIAVYFQRMKQIIKIYLKLTR